MHTQRCRVLLSSVFQIKIKINILSFFESVFLTFSLVLTWYSLLFYFEIKLKLTYILDSASFSLINQSLVLNQFCCSENSSQNCE